MMPFTLEPPAEIYRELPPRPNSWETALEDLVIVRPSRGEERAAFGFETTSDREAQRLAAASGPAQAGAVGGAMDRHDRHAAGELARFVSEPDRRSLVARNAALARKAAKSGLTKAESREFELVRWKLRRLCDVQLEDELDSFEQRIQGQEALACEITRLVAQLAGA